MTLARCDNCNKEAPHPVFNWYKVERWAYPDHIDKRAPTGPWHFCSMKCMGERFSQVQLLEVSTLSDREKKFIEHLPPFNPPVEFNPGAFGAGGGKPSKEPALGNPHLRYRESGHATLPQWLCNHANENPNICDCPPNCSCRIDMCKGKSIPTRYL